MTRTLALAGLLVAASGCQAPRLITDMTTDGSTMKMVYSQAGGARTGLIQCDMAADGSLVNCTPVPITFNDGRN